MGSQVAVTEVAVVPTFKGFRRTVSKETDTAAKQSSQGFSRTFSKTGADSGKNVGAGFKKAFEQSSKGTTDRLTKAIEADVAKSSRALSAARLKEQDAAGRVRLAERQLAEARQKYSRDSSQVVRAEERLATASRQVETAHERTEEATNDLRRAQGDLARAADRTGDELAEAGDRGIKGFRTNILGGVKSFSVPLIGAFAALGIGNIVADAFRSAKDFVSESIDIASDLNESVNAVSVAYGEATEEVLKLGENSAKAFGLSKGELNAYATQFSAFVKNIAGEGGDVAGTLEELVGRGTDFASVFNLEVSDALQLFQSGLAGETEPLRKYGIDLSATAVEAYALSSGLVKASVDTRKVELAQNGLERSTEAYSAAVAEYGEESEQAAKARDAVTRSEISLEKAMSGSNVEMTEAQKQQARYAYLLEQTNAVQGDFVNTSDELANKNRINAAEWENIQAKIGDSFLPVASELADILGDDILPLIAQLAEDQGPELADAFADIIPELTELAQELLPLLPDLFEGIIATLPGVIALMRILGPLFVSAAQDNGTWVTVLQGWLDVLSGTTSPEEFAQKIIAMEGPLADTLEGAYNLGLGIHDLLQDFITFGTLVPVYMDGFQYRTGSAINAVIAYIRAMPLRAIEALGDLSDDLFQSGQALIGGFLRGITSAPVEATMSGMMRQVGDYFPHSPAKKGPFSGAGWTQLEKSGEAFWDQWVGGMGGAEPPFGSLPDPGALVLSGPSGAATSSAGGAGRSVSQTNHFDKTDPAEAVELANQQLTAMLRSA